MKPLLLFFTLACCVGCGQAVFKKRWLNQQAPAQFVAYVETSKGRFEVEVTRAWSPLAADRFYQMLTHHFYDKALFYRVVPRFVAQFGTSDSTTYVPWMQHAVPDEAVLSSNLKGTLSYARDGLNSRGRELFINLKDNIRLDTITYNGVKGFPPFGKVIKGMEVVEALYGGYGDKTMPALDTLYQQPAVFMQRFPLLDKVIKAGIK